MFFNIFLNFYKNFKFQAINLAKKRPHKIIERNVHLGAGELDIVAQFGDLIVFVEVKARNNYSFGNPLEAMTKQKIKMLIQTAKQYISFNHLLNIQVRFDVISIVGTEIEHIEDAFWLN